MHFLGFKEILLFFKIIDKNIEYLKKDYKIKTKVGKRKKK